MGYWKEREIEQDGQGWRYSDSSICFRCLTDSYLRDMVKSSAKEFECTFCGWHSRVSPNSVPFNDVMGVIADSVFQYYNHAEEEPIAWDSEDQQYIGTTYDTRELIRDVIGEPSDNETVIEEIIDSFGDNVWCEKDPYWMGDDERYQASWEGFCSTVKHQIRYFFDSVEKKDEYSERIPVPDMLDALRDVIDEAGLVGTLPENTKIFRVRVHDRAEKCDSWRPLGSPPHLSAATSRMSAGGISVFYGALDLATAKLETTVNTTVLGKQVLTSAAWENTRPLSILDLTKLPAIPSFYARVRYDRDHLAFLKQFVQAITQAIAHDGKEHIEYVPTQILTEYFRHRYVLHDKSQLDGILYPSAHKRNGRAIVVFASQEDLKLQDNWGNARTPILKMVPDSIKRLRKPRTSA